MKKLFVSIAALLLIVAPTSAAHAQVKSTPKNSGITGVWLGTNYGFVNGVFKSNDLRFTIQKVNGVTFAGVKSWRQSNGEWSEPEPFMGIMYKNGEFHAADTDGVLIGKGTSPNKIRATYLEVGEDQAALVMNLTKASR
jgi:acid phosphatase class B